MSYAIAIHNRGLDPDCWLVRDSGGDVTEYATATEAVKARPISGEDAEYFAVDLDKISLWYFDEDGDERCWGRIKQEDICELPCVSSGSESACGECRECRELLCNVRVEMIKAAEVFE